MEFPEEPEIRRLYPQGYHGVDKMGRPLYIERLGMVDVSKLLKTVNKERLLQFWVKEYEITLYERLPATGTRVTCSILDVGGIGLSSLKREVREFIGSLFKIASDHYPEIMGNLYIVNAPTAFTAVWAIIKPMLDPNTRKKIVTLGKNFPTKISDVVDVEKLPPFLHGKCTACGVDGCLTKDLGPWILDRSKSDVNATSTAVTSAIYPSIAISRNTDEFVSVASGEFRTPRSDHSSPRSGKIPAVSSFACLSGCLPFCRPASSDRIRNSSKFYSSVFTHQKPPKPPETPLWLRSFCTDVRSFTRSVSSTVC
jgi:hypothetical protein